MAQKRVIEIQADRVAKAACPKCGSVVDATAAPAFSVLQCAQCQTKFAAPGRLGGFVLLKELGRGQMGVTYRAFEKVLGRYVAIKVMRASLGGDPKRVKDFMAEGRALASLDHPNAVRIYSIGQEKGQPYIAMELVNGRSVGHLMGRDKKLTEARALEIATGVARALRAASEIGLIHSDVKPDNIVLDEKGRAKLVDFGIARFGPGKLEADAAIGTPYYVAPEQVLRASVDHRTDIYSLGATLYHMLSGSPPFPGTDLQTVLNARLKKNAPSLMKSCRGLHMETVHVVAKMLQKDPARRYQDYDELLKDLRRACWASGAELTQDADDAPLVLASPGHGSFLGKMMLVTVVLLGLAGVGAWAMFFRGDKKPTDVPGAAVVRPDQVAAPVFSPKARKIAGPTEIRVSCDTSEADIYYTTDGNEPTQESSLWTGVVKIEPGTTLRARAFRDGLEASEIIEAVYARDSVVLKDVVKIRSDATAAWKDALKLDRAQGFGAKVDQCKQLYEQAGELYKKNAYAAAKRLYTQVEFKCKSLKTLDSTRKTAKTARDKAKAAIRLVPDFGSNAWKPVSDTDRSAQVMFDRGEFPKAYETWGKVITQIDRRYKTMLPAARKSYESALNAAGPEVLKQYGGNEWKKVEEAAKQAAQAGSVGRYGQAVTLYKRAENLLKPASHTANTASAGVKMKQAVASIRALVRKGHFYKARAALAPMLKKSPNAPALKNFDKAIREAVEIKIYLKPGARDERGGLVMPLRLVVPGKFKMGSPESEPGRERHENLHDVEITQPFYIGKCEVSYRQFEEFTKATGYKTMPEKKKNAWCLVLVKDKLIRASGRSWRNPGFSQGRDHPVVCVNWDDANAFCEWLSSRAAGMKISLPTEAQWEYACRQGSQQRFSFGDDATKLCQYGNYADGSSVFATGDIRNSDGKSTTAPVHTYKSAVNHPHLYDMHGNVSEWCSDWYGPYSQSSGGKAAIDPTGIRRGTQRVVRGGSWASTPSKCRSAARSRMAGIMHSALIGFRVVATGKRPNVAQLQSSVNSAAKKDGNYTALTGRVGVGTWETKAEFKEFRVDQGGREIFRLSNYNNQKKLRDGDWHFNRDVLEQRDVRGKGKYTTFGETSWSNYTIRLKARKIAGKEGFRVRLADDGKGSFYLFCVGGQFNKEHLFERHVPGAKEPEYLARRNGKIDQGRWHDVRVELKGATMRGFLDNKLLCELKVSTISRNTASSNGTDFLPDFSGAFTVTAWVRTKAAGTIFAKTPPSGPWAPGGKSLFVGTNGRVSYDIGWSGSFSGRTKISDDKWHHVALVGDSGKQRIYIDGKNDGQGSLASSGDVKGAVGIIGFTAREYPKPSHFTGLVDELCVYNRAMSEREISDASRKPQRGLVGHWAFEGTGSDSSSRRNHAVKMTGVKFVPGKVGRALELAGRGSIVLARGR
ncbi:MAG: SUMF1/EgtB/PvdO family nonheme iron enzyme [Phycisphaerae bacterium]|jgi:formylglycine-generating enzyme required for sulfatase activity/predicted Ser/Thr protein kinase|nr:SUMF1/EgtB/PvdO family nonheme iron enzyme [Phycisphaerae bacterium]